MASMLESSTPSGVRKLARISIWNSPHVSVSGTSRPMKPTSAPRMRPRAHAGYGSVSRKRRVRTNRLANAPINRPIGKNHQIVPMVIHAGGKVGEGMMLPVSIIYL